MDTLFRKSKSSRSSGSTPTPRPPSNGLGGLPYNQLPQSSGLPVAGPSNHSVRRDTNGYGDLKNQISSPTSNQALGRNGPPVPGKERYSEATPGESSRRPSSDASTYNGQRLVSPLPSSEFRPSYTVPRDTDAASIRSVSTVSSLQNPNRDLGRYPSFTVDAQNGPYDRHSKRSRQYQVLDPRRRLKLTTSLGHLTMSSRRCLPA
jgi:hypothetical protein